MAVNLGTGKAHLDPRQPQIHVLKFVQNILLKSLYSCLAGCPGLAFYILQYAHAHTQPHGKVNNGDMYLEEEQIEDSNNKKQDKIKMT